MEENAVVSVRTRIACPIGLAVSMIAIGVDRLIVDIRVFAVFRNRAIARHGPVDVEVVRLLARGDVNDRLIKLELEPAGGPVADIWSVCRVGDSRGAVRAPLSFVGNVVALGRSMAAGGPLAVLVQVEIYEMHPRPRAA